MSDTLSLFSLPAITVAGAHLLDAPTREIARQVMITHHYTHSVSSGKSHYLSFEDALIIYSIPANNNIGRYLTGQSGAQVWELSRLWAPDGHRPNLLTQAIAASVAAFRIIEPDVPALVSYADPNVGHGGGVYRAASWVYLGQCEDGRYYRNGQQVVSRRKFHSGRTILRKAEILAMGYTEEVMPGRHRFAKGLTRQARRAIQTRASATDE